MRGIYGSSLAHHATTPSRVFGKKNNKKGGIFNEAKNQINQQELLDITINVKKIELPKNHAPEIVEKLREANKVIDHIDQLKELKADLDIMRQSVLTTIE